jgi:uroporphyrinogen-III decarboxylase
VVNNYEELKILAYAVDHLTLEPPAPRHDIYERYDKLIGDEGLPTVNLMNTPFMHLIEFVIGLQNTYLLLHEHREEMEHVLTQLHQSQRRHVEALAASPAQVIVEYENISSTLLSPSYYRKYCLPVQNDYARILKSAGKIYLIHMCGKLRAFIPDFQQAVFSGITDIAPLPTGDLPISDAATNLPGKIVMGGIDATTFASNDTTFVEREVTYVIQKLKPYRGVFLGSGDAMPKNTRVENVRLVKRLVDSLGTYD